ncbi:MAG: dihydroneopterin aldolase [Pseudomonadales bacterium]|nr:dihydroneopterin aldolase [Pseudomonadales bacterium]
MIGTVLIDRLELDCIIGIMPAERIHTQPLFIDVEMDCDFSAAATSEHISDAVDYAEISALLGKLIQDKAYQLVETLVSEACDLILQTAPRVFRVVVTARKPNAVGNAAAVGARMEKRRQG